ncbi:hypothetical protein CYMTET_52131 [Cymbomonas tetramitiformis]|uniref:Uncharacterized protein n=1 Tax=Cymbomonas tetramitiformis TaxID=36881 RepID=A0AAE0ET21_9CHLO|nr:hypothetical protein CYMTET_52131 [Cymbomonas tetramitiformis]
MQVSQRSIQRMAGEVPSITWSGLIGRLRREPSSPSAVRASQLQEEEDMPVFPGIPPSVAPKAKQSMPETVEWTWDADASTTQGGALPYATTDGDFFSTSTPRPGIPRPITKPFGLYGVAPSARWMPANMSTLDRDVDKHKATPRSSVDTLSPGHRAHASSVHHISTSRAPPYSFQTWSTQVDNSLSIHLHSPR